MLDSGLQIPYQLDSRSTEEILDGYQSHADLYELIFLELLKTIWAREDRQYYESHRLMVESPK